MGSPYSILITVGRLIIFSFEKFQYTIHSFTQFVCSSLVTSHGEDLFYGPWDLIFQQVMPIIYNLFKKQRKKGGKLQGGIQLCFLSCANVWYLFGIGYSCYLTRQKLVKRSKHMGFQKFSNALVVIFRSEYRSVSVWFLPILTKPNRIDQE